jgi:hypothetical protein
MVGELVYRQSNSLEKGGSYYGTHAEGYFTPFSFYAFINSKRIKPTAGINLERIKFIIGKLIRL